MTTGSLSPWRSNPPPMDQETRRLLYGYSSAPTATIAPLAPPDVPIPTIVGVMQLIFDPTEPCLTLPNPVELNRLYIEEAYQSSGLAASLVDEAGSSPKQQFQHVSTRHPPSPVMALGNLAPSGSGSGRTTRALSDSTRKWGSRWSASIVS